MPSACQPARCNGSGISGMPIVNTTASTGANDIGAARGPQASVSIATNTTTMTPAPSIRVNGLSNAMTSAAEQPRIPAMSTCRQERPGVSGTSARLAKIAPLTASCAACGSASVRTSTCTSAIPTATVMPLITCVGRRCGHLSGRKAAEGGVGGRSDGFTEKLSARCTNGVRLLARNRWNDVRAA